jgi:hydroxyethylthiazole kinase-like uncharacterized protein yjeF
MQSLYTTTQIRAIEQTHGTLGLMEKAGQAVAELARNLTEDGLPILVLAGPGNNGGDALVAARHLKHAWHRVDVVFTGDAARLPADAKAALDAWLACGGEILSEIPCGNNYGLVLDGLFGIGLIRPLEGAYATLIDQINTIAVPKLAIDVASGLCTDSGRIMGSAIRADYTLTFLGLKPGLFTLDGPDCSGIVHVSDLGVTTDIMPQGGLIDAPPALPNPRRRNSHKGSYGSVGVLGGDSAMTGAALLAARAALLTGAGRVYAGLLAGHAPAVDFSQPELMLRSAETLLDLNHLSALVVGPGMGHSGAAEAALQRAIDYPAALLLDADALTLLAKNTALRNQFGQRSHGNILTPHPGEAATLLECSVAEVQSDRIAAAQRIARDYHAIAVLKGCGSIVAFPDGRWFVNASGNAGMASGGMGDVLAGIIGSLAAQGMAPEQATLLGVYLHGAAADSLVADGVGPVGLTASEVTQEARNLLNKWTSCKTP